MCARHPGLSAVREAEPLGHDPKLWGELRAAGLPGLGLAEEHGGSGADLAALLAVAEVLGELMAPVPFIEHAVAGRLLASMAPDHPLLPRLADGSLIATIAPNVVAGVGRAVPAGAVADVVIGVDDGQLVMVQSAPPGVASENLGSLPLADRSLRDGERSVLAAGVPERSETAGTEGETLVAGWLTGLSRTALEIVTGWVKERHQFGVPIGSFQAIQHGLADLPGLIDGSALLAAEAAWAQAGGARSITGASGRQLAAMALIFAAETAKQVTGRVVQYHGGLGVALEHDAQLLYRRARAYPLLGRTPRATLRDLGAALIADGG